MWARARPPGLRSGRHLRSLIIPPLKLVDVVSAAQQLRQLEMGAGAATAIRQLRADTAISRSLLESIPEIQQQEVALASLLLDDARRCADEAASSPDLTEQTAPEAERTGWVGGITQALGRVTERASTIAQPGVKFTQEAIKSAAGFETQALEVQQQIQQVGWLTSVLLAQSISGKSHLLQEALVSRTRAAQLLKVSVEADWSIAHGLTVNWDSNWPNDRVAAWNVELVFNSDLSAIGQERRVVLASSLAQEVSQYAAATSAPEIVRELASSRDPFTPAFLRAGCLVEVSPVNEGATVKETNMPPGVSERIYITNA